MELWLREHALEEGLWASVPKRKGPLFLVLHKELPVCFGCLIEWQVGMSCTVLFVYLIEHVCARVWIVRIDPESSLDEGAGGCAPACHVAERRSKGAGAQRLRVGRFA